MLQNCDICLTLELCFQEKWLYNLFQYENVKIFFHSSLKLEIFKHSTKNLRRRQENHSQYCFCFLLNYRLSKLLSPLGRKKGLFFFIAFHGCQDATQGAVKWKGSDLFEALSMYWIFMKHDGKFIKRPRTDLKLEIVFNKHSNRSFAFVSWDQIPCMLKKIGSLSWFYFGTEIPW